MRFHLTRHSALVGLFCLVATSILAGSVLAEDAKIDALMTKELTGLPGKEGMMLMVEYAPGGSSAKHQHHAHTFVYVLEGSIVMQVEGGKAVTLGPGQTFYEAPDDVHTVSKNASDTRPAKFLIFFVKNKDAPLLVPAQ
jgi:quercetin dioxygenase-like cupin family protein